MRPGFEEDDWHSREGYEKAGEECVRDGLPQSNSPPGILVVGARSRLGSRATGRCGEGRFTREAVLDATERAPERSPPLCPARHSEPESTGRSRSELRT